jgi:hypothetical protein
VPWFRPFSRLRIGRSEGDVANEWREDKDDLSETQQQVNRWVGQGWVAVWKPTIATHMVGLASIEIAGAPTASFGPFLA